MIIFKPKIEYHLVSYPLCLALLDISPCWQGEAEGVRDRGLRAKGVQDRGHKNPKHKVIQA